MTGKIKGIVFDLDGTLIHSDIDFPKMKRRMIEILEDRDIPKGMFTPKQTTVVILAEADEIWSEQGKEEAEIAEIHEALEKTMNHGELEAISTVEEVEGASDALRLLKERGYMLAVLTRSHHTYAVEALKKIRAHEYFDLILGRNETRKPKPNAEALRHTSELLGLSLDEILFVGDNHIDHATAVNAECLFVGVRSGPRGDDSWAKNWPEILLDDVSSLLGYLEKA
jgi:HAD superfamily hydrolase (TIGR01549 family)